MHKSQFYIYARAIHNYKINLKMPLMISSINVKCLATNVTKEYRTNKYKISLIEIVE